MDVPRPRRKIRPASVKKPTKKQAQRRIANRDSASTKAAIKARKRVPVDCPDIPF